MPRLSFIQYRCPSWYTGEVTFDPLRPVHWRWVLRTPPLPTGIHTHRHHARPTAERPHHIVVREHARDDVPADVVRATPELVAGRRVEAEHLAEHREEQFRLPARPRHQNGRVPRLA